MKKLSVGIVYFALIFSGYRVAVGTRSVARADPEHFRAATNSTGLSARVPASSDQPEEELSAADTEVLLVGTLIAFVIIADALSSRNRCAETADGTVSQGGSRLPMHKSQTQC